MIGRINVLDAAMLTAALIVALIGCDIATTQHEHAASDETVTYVVCAECGQQIEPMAQALSQSVAPDTATATTATTILYDVPLDAELQRYIIETAEQHDIDPAVVFAVCWQESTCVASTIGDNGNSWGLMQIQPRWHCDRMQRLGCMDLLDPYQNVTVGIDYLAELLDRYDGDIAKALTAYNQGSYKGTVTKYASSVMSKADALAASSCST